LVVDDHPPTRLLIRSVIQAEKDLMYEVVEAGSGKDCLMAADARGPFDLILLDVNLPDMDGFDVCRAIRRVDTEVPIVFVTGLGELKDFAAGRAAGGDSYIVKPIARQALRAMVSLFTSVHRTRPRQPTGAGGESA
jgi:DNA-binding response OmpR family regulator